VEEFERADPKKTNKLNFIVSLMRILDKEDPDNYSSELPIADEDLQEMLRNIARRDGGDE
jgi:hypothetical protein